MTRTVIAGAEVDGRNVDVLIDRGRVAAVGGTVHRGDADVIDAAGGALLPGLHDHHIHLLAMAAARRSVDVSGTADDSGFDAAVRAAHAATPPGRWLRVVGYGEQHGQIDRQRLDHLAPARPVRVQHRSGAMWVMSSTGLAAAGLDHGADTLHRLDEVLRDRLPPEPPPELTPVGVALARFGVTGVTDATPYERSDSFDVLAAAHRRGDLPQRVVVTGGAALASWAPPAGLEPGPVKVVIADNALPGVDEIATAFRDAHHTGRPVAVHCVTATALAIALAAWGEVGAADGDRIEHGSVIPSEAIGQIRRFGLCVVTQPGFIADRGDRYLAEVDAIDQPDLYRCRSLLEGGVPVAGSTDAPFGPDDPWVAMKAAVERRAPCGATVGSSERLDAGRALRLFLGSPGRPGGPARRVSVGAPADLCLLHVPLQPALLELSSDLVRQTWITGQAQR